MTVNRWATHHLAMSENVTLSERVAEVIRAMLWQRRMSGRQLAAELKVSQSWMSTRLAGTTPIDLNDLERIAGILDIEVWDLIPQREGKLIAVGGAARPQRAESKPWNLGAPNRPRPKGPRSRNTPSAVNRRTGRVSPALAAA